MQGTKTADVVHFHYCKTPRLSFKLSPGERIPSFGSLNELFSELSKIFGDVH